MSANIGTCAEMGPKIRRQHIRRAASTGTLCRNLLETQPKRPNAKALRRSYARLFLVFEQPPPYFLSWIAIYAPKDNSLSREKATFLSSNTNLSVGILILE